VPAARIAEIAFSYIFGRALRRAMLVALIGVLTFTAIYHFTIAGMLALEAQYGLLYARLIVGTAYSAAALVTTIIFWAMRTKRPNERRVVGAIAAPRNAQIAMLIEAGMLGYTFGRKSRHGIH
jgi:hypothetical protein